jgi:hypothetical protein
LHLISMFRIMKWEWKEMSKVYQPSLSSCTRVQESTTEGKVVSSLKRATRSQNITTNNRCSYWTCTPVLLYSADGGKGRTLAG